MVKESTLKRSSDRQKWEDAKYKRRRHAKPLSEEQLKLEVLDGTVVFSISDTGATSSAGHVGDPLIQTSTL